VANEARYSAVSEDDLMLLSSLAPIAATISGLSAKASLIYVAIQTRQSGRHARAKSVKGPQRERQIFFSG
jgi:hypothetical protein